MRTVLAALAVSALAACAAGSNPDVDFSHWSSNLHQMNTGYETRQIMLLNSMRPQPQVYGYPQAEW